MLFRSLCTIGDLVETADIAIRSPTAGSLSDEAVQLILPELELLLVAAT